jgi:hypothetical protein
MIQRFPLAAVEASTPGKRALNPAASEPLTQSSKELSSI